MGFVCRFVLAMLIVLGVGAVPIAMAAPPTARIVGQASVGSDRVDLSIDSPAMGKVMTVSVLVPPDRDATRGTLYMLDGASGGDSASDWLTKGKAPEYFRDKNVTVVLPAGGAGSFYTDWKTNDPTLGRPQWETFLTRELPPLIDAAFHGNGRHAVLGLSMGGYSAMALIARHPEVYTGAASLSGCPAVSSTPNQAYVYATVAREGGSASNMWGAPTSGNWPAHDPTTRLGALRGKNLFVAAGSGDAGPYDENRPADPGQTRELTLALGDAIERAVGSCSRDFTDALHAEGVPVVEHYPAIGTHSWPYWVDYARLAWPVLSAGL